MKKRLLRGIPAQYVERRRMHKKNIMLKMDILTGKGADGAWIAFN